MSKMPKMKYMYFLTYWSLQSIGRLEDESTMKVIKLKIQLLLERLLRIFRQILIRSKHQLVPLFNNRLVLLTIFITVNALIFVWCLWSLHRSTYTPYFMSKSLVDEQLQDRMQVDKGQGCRMPSLDPFSPEVSQFDRTCSKVKCSGQDWVRCYNSECKVIQAILDTHTLIRCKYRDVLYITDYDYKYGTPFMTAGDGVYILRRSDYVWVYCQGWRNGVSKMGSINVSVMHVSWTGLVAGYRDIKPKTSPKGRENATNVVVFAFESTPRTGFIRRMPKSYKFLTEVLKASVLKGYNVVGDGTHFAVLPVLTGRNPVELESLARASNRTWDQTPLIFHNLTHDGYRTAYLEDDSKVGTLQYKNLSFRHRPIDHYSLPFVLTVRKLDDKRSKHCVGDTPKYKLFMDLTYQFLHLKGKKFIFTFLTEFTHEDFNMIATADDDFVEFLQKVVSGGFLEDTMLVVMGDHGHRYFKYQLKIQDTPRVRLEERLPFLAIVLPQKLKSERPSALMALRKNVDTLATPYDMHSTFLDAVGLREAWNPYKVPGADIPRGMSLLEPIPQNRSCSEAGITPHWCACLSWEEVPISDPMYKKSSLALLRYINDLTEPHRIHCLRRTLTAVLRVVKIPNAKTRKETYQVKMTVDPDEAKFEATMTYLVDSDTFRLDRREISRNNKYGYEPKCISKSHPHLKPYCYCQT